MFKSSKTLTSQINKLTDGKTETDVTVFTQGKKEAAEIIYSLKI